MGRSLGVIILVVMVVGLIAIRLMAYTVDETNFVVVRQLGKISAVRTLPGLSFKLPNPIQDTTYLDKRIQTSDTSPQEYLTSDEKRVVVDQVTRWRIKRGKDEVRNFFLNARTISGGNARLEPLVLAELKAQIANRPYDVMISAERDSIMDIVKGAVQARVDDENVNLGIEVIDIRTKRADLPSTVEQSVYQRMQSARRVEADRHRAQGQQRSDQITAQTDREVQVMLACADRVSKETRGAGEAAAITIFAQALEQDPEFYSFIRTLEAYRLSFTSEDSLVMSTDSNFFRLLKGQAATIPDIEATKGDVVLPSAEIVAPLTQERIDELISECTPETVQETAASQAP